MKLKKVFFFVFLFVPSWIFAQYNTIHLQPNAHYTKTSDVSATTKMVLDGQEYAYAVSASMKTDYNILSKDSERYAIKITLDAINSELSSNGVKMSFDSQKDTLANIEDTIFAKPLSDILGESNKVLVDSTGEILESDSSQIHRKAAEYITSTLLSGNDYTIGKRLDIIFHFKDSVKVGTTWIDSMAVDKDGMRVDTFSVEKIFNKVVYVNVNGYVKRTLPVQQGSTVAMAHFEGSSNAVLHVSQFTGIVNSRKMKTLIHSQINVNNKSIPISSEIQLSEVVQ
ncbi:MAG: hypothetical protein DI598_07060 [Pseudopedobacter saltans]|uniref:Gliding motility-associated protein GldM C-terminal domain-containing protein n=1 Tax=Pseudopedobacter saltans TaxID=151895 RepID=A0A2W5F0P5_9SPHI|nr:MAG: hypothetical protein DI598_07060 [Pseudopedobacter saltans]